MIPAEHQGTDSIPRSICGQSRRFMAQNTIAPGQLHNENRANGKASFIGSSMHEPELARPFELSPTRTKYNLLLHSLLTDPCKLLCNFRYATDLGDETSNAMAEILLER